jgi:hypothetical protein
VDRFSRSTRHTIPGRIRLCGGACSFGNIVESLRHHWIIKKKRIVVPDW